MLKINFTHGLNFSHNNTTSTEHSVIGNLYVYEIRRRVEILISRALSHSRATRLFVIAKYIFTDDFSKIGEGISTKLNANGRWAGIENVRFLKSVGDQVEEQTCHCWGGLAHNTSSIAVKQGNI